MARVYTAVSRWESNPVPCSCEWCGQFIVPGSWRLRVGTLRLICCRRCAKDRRGLEPPEVDEVRDPKMDALPVGDR